MEPVGHPLEDLDALSLNSAAHVVLDPGDGELAPPREMRRREACAAPLLGDAQHRAEVALRARPHEVWACQHDLRQEVRRSLPCHESILPRTTRANRRLLAGLPSMGTRRVLISALRPAVSWRYEQIQRARRTMRLPPHATCNRASELVRQHVTGGR